MRIATNHRNNYPMLLFMFPPLTQLIGNPLSGGRSVVSKHPSVSNKLNDLVERSLEVVLGLPLVVGL